MDRVDPIRPVKVQKSLMENRFLGFLQNTDIENPLDFDWDI